MSPNADEQGEPLLISEIPFGRYLFVLAPFGLWLALVYVVDAGLVHATREDTLWSIQSAHPLSDERAAVLDDSTVVSIQRTLCFGTCPAYSLKLFGSGKVEFKGENFVCAFGPHTGNADRREIHRLVNAMIGTGYFGYSWSRGLYVTDAPAVITSLQHAGRSYVIRHYHGDQGAPKWLSAMEDEIDRVAGTAKWLPVHDAEWRSSCSTPEGWRDVTFSEPRE